MCILLYVKLLQCTGFPERDLCSIGGGGTSAFGICAFFYMSYLFGVVIFQRSMLNWRKGAVSLPWVYVHSSIYETYLQMKWFCRDLWSIGRGYICLQYMCILLYVLLIWCSTFCHGYMCIPLYVKLMWCSGFPEIYA